MVWTHSGLQLRAFSDDSADVGDKVPRSRGDASAPEITVVCWKRVPYIAVYFLIGTNTSFEDGNVTLRL